MQAKRKKGWIVALAAVAVLLIVGVILMKLPSYRWTRILFGISDFFRDLGLQSPEDVTRVDNVRYGEDRLQVLDIYYPKGTTEKLPTIVSIHGGGWTYGSKEIYQYYGMQLAEHGYTVVNFSYRLAPKNRYPAAIEDTNSVMRFISEHADEYHIDTNNIFFVGDSAGAQLNAQYTTAVTNPAYAALLGLSIPDFTLRATALNCGVYDQSGMNGILAYYLADESQKAQLDIFPYITADFPPAFVMSATGDMCLPYAEPMYDFLQSKGVTAELHIYGDEENKPPHVFHVNVKNPTGVQCNDDECTFFAQYTVK